MYRATIDGITAITAKTARAPMGALSAENGASPDPAPAKRSALPAATGSPPELSALNASIELHKRRLTESLQPLDTVADAIRTKALGAEPWRVVHDDQAVERTVFAVDNEQIRTAMRFSFQRMKVVVEPAGATALVYALATDMVGRHREDEDEDE